MGKWVCESLGGKQKFKIRTSKNSHLLLLAHLCRKWKSEFNNINVWWVSWSVSKCRLLINVPERSVSKKHPYLSAMFLNLLTSLTFCIGSWECQTVGKNQPVKNFSFWMIITVHFAWSFTLLELMVVLFYWHTHCFKLLLLLKNCQSLSSISTFHRLNNFPFMYNAASSEINISNLH